jgi:hypothetical protein
VKVAKLVIEQNKDF